MRIAALVCLLMTGALHAQFPSDSNKLHFNDWMQSQAALTVYHLSENLPDSVVPLDALTDSLVSARMALLDAASPLDLRMTPEVKQIIAYYLRRRQQTLGRALGHGDHYFPLFESALDRHGMPLELKYLPIIESALNPLAQSPVGAKGIWQFMYATGKMQGLEISSYVDERSDPVLATDAACRYLKKLYGLYDNWELALAAYNAGPGNVNRAIRRAGGSKNFWAIQPYLPRETRRYVPALVAVNYLMAHANDHGIEAIDAPVNYFDVGSITPAKPIALDDVSTVLSLDPDLVHHLNPQYKLRIIPGARENRIYTLVLPLAAIDSFLVHQDSIVDLTAQRMKAKDMPDPSVIMAAVTHHRVKSGETLGHIAQKYRTSVRAIQRENNLRGTVIRAGKTLRIPSR